jgi:hypothetical protein
VSGNDDLGFSFRQTGDACHVFHRGTKAATLRGRKAAKFAADMAEMSFPEQQRLMARLTGNYRRGNERLAKHHPKNRR